MPDPEQRERRLYLRGLSINRLLPNIITLGALCAGLTAIRFALNADFRSAVLAIIVAAFLDALDGRVARRLNATSKFGAELDSLSDVIAFGVAPAFLLYLSIMNAAGAFGWVVTLMFPICSALRLARFNVGIYAEEKPPVWAGAFFTGIPAPAGALLVLMPLMLSLSPDVDWPWLRHPVTGAVFLVGIGVLMVSRLPSWSLKRGRIQGPWVVPTMVLVALAIGLMATTPWTTLPLIGLVYLLLLPFSYRSYLRTAAREAAAQASAQAQPAPAAIVELRAVGGESGESPRR
jgi:CDP-diacylglycerol---serine O-phosphatidyltransferase